MNNQLKVPQEIIDAMLAQAATEAPRECCGLLGGGRLEVFSCYPLINKAAQPEVRYFAAPEDLFEAMRRMREIGEELIAIYHSHPMGPVYPSTLDIELAFYPQAFYLIIALDPQPEIRAFRIDGATVCETQIDTFTP